MTEDTPPRLGAAPLPEIVISYRVGLPASDVESGSPDVGAPPEQTVDAGPYAVWGDPGELLVVTWGSSRCPQLPATVEVATPTAVAITTTLYLPGGPCTRDYVPTTSVLAAPEGLDETQTGEVTIDGSTTALDPR